MSSHSSPSLTIERLLQLHNLTKDVATYFERNLRSVLDATAPLFRPRRFLGDHMDGQGKESVVGAELNLADLRALFVKAAGSPFNLRKELTAPLQSVSTQIQIHPWEYYHEIKTLGEPKLIQVTSPLTWCLSYPSTYSLSMFRSVVLGKQDRDIESVKAFVLNAVIMHELIAKHATLVSLLESCRYRVEIRRSPLLGELPLVMIAAPFATMRPADDLVNLAAGLAGGSSFQEVIDLEQSRTAPDPLRDHFSEILQKHGEAL